MIRFISAVALLSAGLSVGQLAMAKSELDSEAKIANHKAMTKDLPQTIVFKRDAEGNVYMATVKERLPQGTSEAELAKLTYVKMGKASKDAGSARGELNADQGRETWFVAWGGWGWRGYGWGGAYWYPSAWAYGWGYRAPYAYGWGYPYYGVYYGC